MLGVLDFGTIWAIDPLLISFSCERIYSLSMDHLVYYKPSFVAKLAVDIEHVFILALKYRKKRTMLTANAIHPIIQI